jgi:hypothetical protein
MRRQIFLCWLIIQQILGTIEVVSRTLKLRSVLASLPFCRLKNLNWRDNRMNSGMNFAKGVGLGILVGSAIGMAVAAPKKNGKKMVGKALRSVGEVIESINDAMGW